MPHMPFHPAPGLSDLAPGWFVLPQNPLTQGESTVLVPTMAATAPGRWLKQPTLADLVQGSFVVPQNPLADQLAMGLAGLRGMRGLGCRGCGGSGQPYGLNGVGTDTVSQWLATNGGSTGQWLADETTVAGFTMPMWGWLAAGAGALYVASDLFGKGRAASKRYAGHASRRLSAYASS